MFDWLKVFPYVFKEMIGGLKELQQMAGGRKRGQFVYWSLFIIFLVALVLAVTWATKPAYESLSSVLNHFNVDINDVDVNIPSSIFPNLLLALLLSILYLVVLAGFGAIVGIFFGTITSAIFSPNTTGRIDNIFSELIPLLKTYEQESHNDVAMRLLNDANVIQARWNKSRITRMTRLLRQIGKRPKKGSKK